MTKEWSFFFAPLYLKYTLIRICNLVPNCNLLNLVNIWLLFSLTHHKNLNFFSCTCCSLSTSHVLVHSAIEQLNASPYICLQRYFKVPIRQKNDQIPIVPMCTIEQNVIKASLSVQLYGFITELSE